MFVSSPPDRRGGNRTLDLTLIRGLLSPLSYAPASGAEGTRTLTCRIKSPVCCRYTTTPNAGRAYAFPSCLLHRSCSLFPVVALRVELSATRLSAVFGQPALDYHVPTSLSIQSGWQDSNLRLRAPKARGFAATLHPVIPVRTAGFEPAISWPPTRRDTQASLRSALSGSCGSRTRLPALKGRCPQTDRRTSHRRRAPSTQLTHGVCAHLSRSGSGGARIRVSCFSAGATPSQLPTQTKKARCRCDTGLSVFFGNRYGQVSHAQWIGRDAYSPIDRRMYPSILAVRNSAVSKSWLFLVKRAARRGPPTMYSIV